MNEQEIPMAQGMLDASTSMAHTTVALLVLACVATGVYLLVRFVLSRLLAIALRKWLNDHTPLANDRFWRHISGAAFWVAWQWGLMAVPGLGGTTAMVLRNLAAAMTLLHGMLGVGALLNAIAVNYAQSPLSRTRSIKGYIEVAKIAIYVLGTVCVIATLMDRSPVILLSGLGAMSAVTMLVFKDTILSFVAGLQIANNDMLRVGDWIEMPQLNADGDVTDIALHTVKVQNWDKTITTIPTYRLISESFRNWRGMRECGGRRIKRSVKLDIGSIGFLDETQLARLSEMVLLRDYLCAKEAEIERWNAALPPQAQAIPINCRRLTNIGTFRAYVQAYLESHPCIHSGMTCMVRQMAPESEGLPLEIYCFTNTVVWTEYERIQSDIFDHLFSVLPEFSLRPFQSPSGYDFRLMKS